MKRIMAIDYGSAKTGVAISDLLCSLVGSTQVIRSKVRAEVIEQICSLAREFDVGELVLGLPKNMDGTEGPRAELSRDLARQLEVASGLPVRLWDERRTTVQAHQILSSHNYRMKEQKKIVDAVAAALILEAYLDFRGP